MPHNFQPATPALAFSTEVGIFPLETTNEGDIMQLLARWQGAPASKSNRAPYSLMSIGNFCRTRYQIDQFMNSVSPGYEPVSLFFDWLFLGGLLGVIDLFRRDFEIVEDDIGVHSGKEGFIPRDKRSGMGFRHDFGTRHEPWESLDECRLHMANEMKDSLEKFRYLAVRTRAFMAEKNVALIYQSRKSEQRHLHLLAQQLLQVIRSKYSGQFLFVNVIEEGKGVSLFGESIVTVAVNDDGCPKNDTPEWWQGSDESWSRAFSSIFSPE